VSGIVHQPIGHPLSPKAFANLTMTPRGAVAERGVRDADDRRLQALGNLPAASDDEAGLAGPIEYTLGEAVGREIDVCVEGLAEANANAKRADAELAAALHASKSRYGHESVSGLLAARAFTSKSKADKDALAANAAALRLCDEADARIPELKALAAENRRLQGLAFGTLRGVVAKGFDNLRLKAGRRYTELAAEMTRCIAVINATTELQPRSTADLASAMNVFHLHLSVPSLPDPLHCQEVNGREMLHWSLMLVAPLHSRLTTNTVAAKSAITVELRELLAPLGLGVGNVTI
jgi:hypothetical protein